jgi:uncharacterized protein VirK/YbjX
MKTYRNSMTGLWKLSGIVCEQSGLRQLRQRVLFVAKALTLKTELEPFLLPSHHGSLARIMQLRPELVGAAIWPYICSDWEAGRRLRSIVAHYSEADGLGAPFNAPADKATVLLDMSDVYDSLHVVLDQPLWFLREGLLVLNLFLGDRRIYSTAFSFARESGERVVYVGAIQGSNSEDVTGDYKALTKALHGMRPRDFLVELLRSVCRAVGVHQIYAVAEGSRHHRNAYFGGAKNAISVDYDEIWTERGGVRHSSAFFVLSVQSAAKSLDDVPSKKRAMYRRRYDMLGAVESAIAVACVNRGTAEAHAPVRVRMNELSAAASAGVEPA